MVESDNHDSPGGFTAARCFGLHGAALKNNMDPDWSCFEHPPIDEASPFSFRLQRNTQSFFSNDCAPPAGGSSEKDNGFSVVQRLVPRVKETTTTAAENLRSVCRSHWRELVLE